MEPGERTNVEWLRAEGILQEGELTQEEMDLVNSLTAEEVDALIAIRAKFSGVGQDRPLFFWPL